MNESSRIGFRAALLLVIALCSEYSWAQGPWSRAIPLASERQKSGAAVLRAFSPIAKTLRESVVRLEIGGESVAFGTAVDEDGLLITKASEVRGQIICRFADGHSASAKLMGVDEENDLALLQVAARDLKPVVWASQPVVLGQWTLTPGIEVLPEAVGIVSAPSRKIPRSPALIGIQFDFNSSAARIGKLIAGLGAEKAGLKPGDIILSVDDTSVNGRQELVTKVRTFHEGDTIKLRVQREDEEFDVQVKLVVPSVQQLGEDLSRQDRLNRLGSDLSERADGFERVIEHDTVLQAWECGGPLVNLDGKVVGINIARAGRANSYALPAPLVRQIVDRLKARRKI